MADASEEFRRVFTGALEEESGLELAAETGDGQETVRLAKELSPDIVVMDFVLARMDADFTRAMLMRALALEKAIYGQRRARA